MQGALSDFKNWKYLFGLRYALRVSSVDTTPIFNRWAYTPDRLGRRRGYSPQAFHFRTVEWKLNANLATTITAYRPVGRFLVGTVPASGSKFGHAQQIVATMGVILLTIPIVH
jgi:hypothetical protein